MKRITLVFLTCLTLLVAGCGDRRSSEEHLAEAEALLARNEYRTAIIELKNALVKDAGNAQARLLLGRASLAVEDIASAEKELRQSLDMGIPPAEVYPDFARALLAQGEHAALKQLSTADLDDEGRSTVRAVQALSLLEQGQSEEALDEMDRLLDEPPVSTFALVAGARISGLRDPSGEEARYLLGRATDMDPEYAPAWSLLGDVAVRNGDLAEAEAHYSKAVDTAVNTFAELYKRALVRVNTQAFEDARIDLRAMRAIAESHPAVSFLQGLLLIGRNETDEARPYFETAAQEPGRYPLALYYLAAIQREEGSLETARNSINRFLTLLPENEAGRKLGATIAYQQQDFKRIPTLLQPVVANNPSDVDALNLLANSLIALGETERGMALLQRVAEQQPESAEALTRLGAGMLATGKRELGVENLRAALKLEPRYERAEQALVGALVQQGDIPAATEQAKTYLEKDAEDPSRHTLLGRVYLAAGDVDAARQEFHAALKLQPGEPEASQMLAGMAMQTQDFDGARTVYEGVLAENPAHLQTLINLAALNALEGEEQAMVDTLQRARDAHPAALQPRLVLARYFLLQSDNEAVIDLLDELPEQQRRLPPVAIVSAEARLNLEAFAEARRELDALLKQQPANARAWFLMARASVGLERMPRGIQELERAVELSPDFALAQIALARLYLLTGAADKLQKQVALLRELAPDSPDVMRLEASVANQRGEGGVALERLEAVFDQQPSAESAIALAVQRRAGGDEAQAIAGLREWLADHPDNVRVRTVLAELLTVAGEEDAAIDAYKELLQLDGNNVLALNNLAWQLKNRDPAAALAYIERALAAMADAPPASLLDTRAMIHLENGDLDQARRSIDQARRIAPDRLSIRYNSARISLAEGDREVAERELSALLQSDAAFPEKAEAQSLLQELKQGG